MSQPPLVLSWNHHDSRAEWHRIEATRVIPEREVVEVCTASGRKLTCTSDHQIYTANGYRAAALLQPGDALLVGRPEQASGLRDVRQGAQEQESDVSLLLHGGSGEHVPRPPVQSLRRAFLSHASRALEESAARAVKLLLLSGLQGSGTKVRRTGLAMLALRFAHRIERSSTAVLFTRMPLSDLDAETEDQGMPAVRDSLRVQQRASSALHSGMRGCGTFGPDDWQWKLPLQDRDQLRRVVQAHASVDSATGSASVPSLFSTGPARPSDTRWQDADAEHSGSASHKRAPMGELAGKPDPPMHYLPRGSSQVGYDTVSMVRQLRGERHAVYDLQVEGNCNFFAEEVLVHNCMIIDDPTKGRAEADSDAYQENTWEWWTETARTRLAPHAPVVVIQTRWHQQDLAGRLIEQDQNWRSINIPALCEASDDPLGREVGEYLISARGRTPEMWEQIHRDVGDRAWNALYQGRPAPAEGGMFKRVWWQYDNSPVVYRKADGTMQAQGMDVVIQSWDMTFKNTDGTDFVVGQVWGRAGATAHLLDQVRARLDFPQTCKAVEDLSKLWPQATLKLIEDKANGPAVIAQLRKKVAGMVPVNPEGNKQARASAVAPFVEAGNVYLPPTARAPWIGAFLEETAGFPTSAHDDQVDAMSQALSRLMLMPSSTAFLDQLVNEQGRGELQVAGSELRIG